MIAGTSFISVIDDTTNHLEALLIRGNEFCDVVDRTGEVDLRVDFLPHAEGFSAIVAVSDHSRGTENSIMASI